MRSFIVIQTAVMLLALPVATLAQCSGGYCPAPQAGFGGYALQSFGIAQFGETLHITPAVQTQAVPPVEYEMADCNGKVWTHRSRAYLTGWITARNEALKARQAAPVVAPRGEVVPTTPKTEKPPKATIDPNPDAEVSPSSTVPDRKPFDVIFASNPVEMNQTNRLPAYAFAGVDRTKIAPPETPKWSTNSAEGKQMIETAKARQAVPEGKRSELPDDRHKPWVTIIGSDQAKRDAIKKQFDDGQPLAEWRDKVHLLAVAPNAWQVKSVGLKSKGDPGVVIQVPNGEGKGGAKVVADLAEPTPDQIDSTLRRINPNFDPKKVPDNSPSLLEWLALGSYLKHANIGTYAVIAGIGFFVFVVYLFILGVTLLLPNKRAT